MKQEISGGWSCKTDFLIEIIQLNVNFSKHYLLIRDNLHITCLSSFLGSPI